MNLCLNELHRPRRLLNKNSYILIGILISGCTLGPNFQRPTAPSVDKYTIEPQINETVDSGAAGGGVQRFNWQQKIPDDWWTLFQSEALNKLIRQALANNPTLAASQARLMQAAEALQAQTGATKFPQVDALAAAERQKFSP
ncbi:MAG TPA: TolC family protein, partial [Steroidobacteraceae bacterium]|nr:TolC family protein [Steroidobacteraceae bacterium]